MDMNYREFVRDAFGWELTEWQSQYLSHQLNDLFYDGYPYYSPRLIGVRGFTPNMLYNFFSHYITIEQLKNHIHTTIETRFSNIPKAYPKPKRIDWETLRLKSAPRIDEDIQFSPHNIRKKLEELYADKVVPRHITPVEKYLASQKSAKRKRG